MKKSNLAGYLLILFSLIIAGAAIFFAPELMKQLDEQKAWASAKQTNEWQSYLHYLQAYPEGRFTDSAKIYQMELDSGKIENIITKEGRVYSYEGQLKQGKAHGQGKARFANGDLYQGSWQGGKFHGQGSYQYASGGNYKGGWERGKFQGKGTISYANGDTYDGMWQAGQKMGKGSYQHVNGDRYHGSWQAGKRHGAGNISFADGRTFRGNFESDLRSGKGVLSWPDGSYFSGQWTADSICLLYTSTSPRDRTRSRMPSSA